MKKYWREGEPMVWATGAALTLTLMIAATLIIVVMVNGLGVFWPKNLTLVTLKSGSRVLGEVVQREATASGEGERLQFKIGNRDLYGLDFRWVDEADFEKTELPEAAMVLERQEYGNFYGMLQSVSAPGFEASSSQALEQLMEQVAIKKQGLEEFTEKINDLNRRTSKLEHQKQILFHDDPQKNQDAIAALDRQVEALRGEFEHLVNRQTEAAVELHHYTATFSDVNGTQKTMQATEIVRYYQPNTMNVFEKGLLYLARVVELFIDDPRESNTEGGLFPAIFGTVMLIFLMSLFSFPLGVIAAVYLREYAKDGTAVRLVRIAVNNLAGIPSIVYGIFGLGFFVYGIGSGIDQIFFPERLPTPTFGTGGILWASLTLALLTVPVVIVATEEALGAIPTGIREGSLALGSTKFQALVRILLPMASPGIMTGLILAMARAAGEVAPLMITGVVKLAPALPLDGTFPFLHLDRKFMHLGFHIYDIAFQSPNVEAAKPMVYVTTLLLVLIVLLMSSVAIHLRNKMKKRYTYGTF
ncbi:MAG: phosphate ABC transporter, permease protein PstA [Desulfuromonadaceae bacterium GWC2_58_13]|nr:MAG: phosphate ABC transporter, permease protein PstA [Desulfuromonadaceae bacterium GWC2_58_13]